jgi:hypothetical protein
VPIIHVRFYSNSNLLNGFSKNTRIKFHENPSSGSLVVSCGWKDRQTDVIKLIVVICNFVNAPKMCRFVLVTEYLVVVIVT